MMADLLHLPRGEGRQIADRLLDRFDLVDAANTLAASYSGGMRRKLDLAMTLVGRRQITFLDEPTAGLDPGSRRTMWEIIRELVAEGIAQELKHQIPGSHVRLRFADRHELDLAGRALQGSTKDDEELTLRVPGDGGVKSLRALLARLDEHSIEVEELSVHTPDLDDVFLALTGQAHEEAIAQ